MIPAQYDNFLIASSQASAALIGLLFVSVSIGPERVFGRLAESGRQALALSAFTALANAFFISFGSLIPDIRFGIVVLVAGLVAASQTLALLAMAPRWRSEHTVFRSAVLVVISAGIYGYEIVLGIQATFSGTNAALLSTLLELLLGTYAIGLTRAWELLGAPHGRGTVSSLLKWVESLWRGPNAPPESGQASAPRPPSNDIR